MSGRPKDLKGQLSFTSIIEATQIQKQIDELEDNLGSLSRWQLQTLQRLYNKQAKLEERG